MKQAAPFESKKGEVNELRVLLKNPAVLKDEKRKRDVVKKVIAHWRLRRQNWEWLNQNFGHYLGKGTARLRELTS